jgi:hypothetical protein
MKPLAILCLALLFSLTPAYAQESKPPALSNDDWSEKTDFSEVRLKYASVTGYNAYLAQAVEKALIAEAMQEWESGNKAEALAKLRKVTEACPLSIEAYRRLADGFAVFIRSTENPEKKSKLESIERHYRIVAEGLLKSIVASGDGKKPKTAFKVISIPEEYMTLWYLGLKPESQSMEQSDGRPFDVVKVRHQKTREESTIYFDIQAFYKEANSESCVQL